MMKMQRRTVVMVGLAASLLLLASGPARAAMGRAIVARMSGTAEYAYPETTAHEYPTGSARLKEGMALSEPQIIRTGKDGHLCVVLTPGAILCVAPDTTIKIEKLEQMPEGLPSSEKELLRRIVLEMSGGSILLHAGTPSANMTIQVRTPRGTVETTGADFILSHSGDKTELAVEKFAVAFRYDGGSADVPAGMILTADKDAATGKPRISQEKAPADAAESFGLCRCYFEDLEPFVLMNENADLRGLADWIGGAEDLQLVGDPTKWEDVSPTYWTPPPKIAKPAALPAATTPSGIWGQEPIWAWYRAAGIVRGVNYLPRTCVNSTEMWQKDTFDPDLIDEELGWAARAGFNSIRIPLQYLVWQEDPREFRKRLDKVLSIANRHGMSVVPILFDDSREAGKDPYLGKQDDPKPGVYNSAWTPSPGMGSVTNPAAWPELEQYVKDVVGSFRRDRRILFWDLYHQPGNSGLWDKSLPLVESVFQWARDKEPKQPLTAGPWTDFGSPMSVRIIELSDLITMQSFDDAASVRARIIGLSTYNRPIVCTGWLDRPKASTFESILPVFSETGVGWYSRGLVRGRAQWYVPDGYKQGSQEPELWRSDVLKDDGSPYKTAEIDLIRNFKFGMAAAGVGTSEEKAAQESPRQESK